MKHLLMIALTVCSLLATEAESPSRIENASPPDGSSTERLWSFDDAWRARTTTRESVCLNGLWQFLPLLPGNFDITRDLGLSTPELIRYRVDLARQFHTNFMISTDYTASAGNSQYMPAFYEELSRAGIMTALTLPHWRNFGGDLNDPEQAELY